MPDVPPDQPLPAPTPAEPAAPPAPPATPADSLPIDSPPASEPPVEAALPPHPHPAGRVSLPLEALLATLLTFGLLGALALLPLSFHAFDPVREVLRDFSYTDTYYSKISREATVDTSILLVNIGHADRAGLAALVRAVGAAQPRAIGLDAFFSARTDTAGTAALAAALASERRRLVTGEDLRSPAAGHEAEGHEAAEAAVQVVGSVPGLAPGRVGFLNFVGDDSANTTVRYFRPFQEVAGKRRVSWAAQLVHLASPAAYAALEKRGRALEAIRYRGNLGRFVAVEGAALTAGQVPPAQVHGKVVVLGFLGESLGSRTSLEDLHFTPLNPEQLGRSLPDMYGSVIQANIVSMLLHGDYITPTPYWLEVLLAFGLCYLHLYLFMYLIVKHHLWYHPLSKLVQTLSGAALVYLMVRLYIGAGFDLGVALPVVVVLLAVDALYLYEALAAWVYRRWGVRSYMVHVH